MLATGNRLRFALPTPPISPPARKRPSCASAVTARTAFRKWKTFPRSRPSPICSFSGSSCSSAPAPARTSRCSRSSSSSTTRTSATSAPIMRRSSRRRRPSLTTIRICPGRARRRPSAGAARHATPTPMPAPRRSPASPASARNISSRRCATTKRACEPAAPWRRWRMSPSRSAKRRSKRWRTISRICQSSMQNLILRSALQRASRRMEAEWPPPWRSWFETRKMRSSP